MLVEITKDVFVDPAEVVSVEKHDEYKTKRGDYGTYTVLEGSGSIITMKNGRKIYVRDVTPEEIFKQLKPKGYQPNCICEYLPGDTKECKECHP